MAPEHTYRIRLMLQNLESIRHLAIDNECMPIRRRDDGLIEMEAFASEGAVAKLRRMRKRDVFVEVLADRAAESAEAIKLVSPDNRYANGALPRGPGSRRD
ncbi:MAG: hypothetical protein ABIU95_14445 [Burkholderiales bacterium]